MEPVGLWEWFGILFLFAIPLIGFIAMIVFACGVGKPGLVNFSRASLIWFAILFGIGILAAILLPALLSLPE